MSDTVVYAVSNGTTTEQSNGETTEQRQVNLHVSPDRMDSVKMGVWRRVENGKMSGMADFVGMFLWNGHSYLSEDEALKVVDNMTTAEIKEASAQLTKLMQNTVASPQ